MSIVGGGTGDNLSPPLSWAGGPDGTMSYALVLFDTRYGVFHWALWDIPADTSSLPEGIPAGYEVSDPPGAHQGGGNGDDPNEYFGPCSDAGPLAGVYEFRLYALDAATLALGADASSTEIQEAIDAATLDMVTWEAAPE
jgi:Raf kinase inhibitor-like YbhB/YbcL family protein